jgi:hypothetical protein
MTKQNKLSRPDELPVPGGTVERQIYLIRGHKVMIDRDLAALYGVETRTLNQGVRRNIRRFPGDFMFQLNRQEMAIWKSQIVISNREKKGLRKPPLVFTEQGVAMLSSILKSERAIQVNIAIMRAFVKLREILSTHKDLARKLEELEKKYDKQFKVVFDAIRELMEPGPAPRRRRIGFTFRRDH